MKREKPLVLTGIVVHGKALGRTVGMPTANLQIADENLLPKEGVYATKLSVDGKTYRSVTNIGLRPTVDEEKEVTVEAHILDFDGDIYGKEVALEVHRFLRPIQKFDSLEAVFVQVKKDIEFTKKILDMNETK